MSPLSFLRHSNPRFRHSRRENLPLAILILSITAIIGLVSVPKRGTESEFLSTTRRQSIRLSILPTSVRATGYNADFCAGTAPTNFLRSTNRAWLAFLLPGIVFTFAGLAVVTENFFVPSLNRICFCLDLSPDVAGATFMAAGSSAPELFTSMLSVFFTEDDLGIGTIVGSAVFNILIIIGLSAVLAKQSLQLDVGPLLRDSVFYVASVIALLVIVLFSTRGRADWWEGLILLVGYALYIIFMRFGNTPYLEAMKKWKNRKIESTFQADVESGTSDSRNTTEHMSSLDAYTQSASDSIRDLKDENSAIETPQQNKVRVMSSFPGEHMNSLDADTQSTSDSVQERKDGNATVETPHQNEVRSFLGVEVPTTALGWITSPFYFPWQLLFRWTIIKCNKKETRKLWPLTFATSIVWIMAISYAMVEMARLAGCFIGIPSSVMGLTILAAGTSVPDALSSIAVARDGAGDMAVSNAIGSNVFDILVGLGLPWFIGGLAKKKAQIITVDPVGLVVIPIAVLFFIIILLVSLLALLKWKLSKKVGYALFTVYAAFVTYTLLDVYVFKIGVSGSDCSTCRSSILH